MAIIKLNIKYRRLAMSLSLFIALLAWPRAASAQCDFDTSIYADGWVTSNYLNIEFVASGYDNSPYCGCQHVTYGSLTIPWDSVQFDQNGNAYLWGDFSEGLYDYSTSLQVYCWCSMGLVWSDYAQGQVNAVSPDCNDERNTIIQEYRDHSISFVPSCAQFTQSRSSAYFSFSAFNTGNFSWALVRQPLIIGSWTGFGLDKWRENYGAQRNLNSVYRNPNRNASVGGAASSRHMFGDAVDMDVVSNGSGEWNDIKDALDGAFPSFIEPINGPCGTGCVHGDWRLVAGAYQ